MGNNRIYRLLARVVDIKPGEERLAVAFFLYFFLITFPYHIIKPIRRATLLSSLGEEYLPLAYLLAAVFTGFVVAMHTQIQSRISMPILTRASLQFFSLTALLFWALQPQEETAWIPLVFWVWTNIMVVVLMAHFWLTVHTIMNPREYRRLVGLFVSGGILGGTAGGLVTSLLAKTVFSDYLLLISSGLLFACIFVIKVILELSKQRLSSAQKSNSSTPPLKTDTPKIGFKESFNTVRRSRYLLLIAAIVMLTMIVSTLIDFQYTTVVHENIQGKQDLTAFFGLFNACLMVFAFLLNLLMTSRIIKNFGIKVTLLLYPIVLFLGSIGIGIAPLLGFGLFLKGSDKSLSYSLNQSVREILYIPLDPDIKNRAKVFIDTFLNRMGKAIGSLILMALLHFSLGLNAISLISCILILVWILLNLKVSREYVTTVKQNIKLKWGRADKAVTDILDIDHTKLVFDTLESRNRSSVLYAMHMYDLLQQDKLTPDIKRLISQKSDELQAVSLSDMFNAEGATWFPEMGDELSQDALRSDIQEIMSLDAYQQVMKLHAEHVMEASKKTEIEKMEIAKAVGMMDTDARMLEILSPLIYDDSPEVARYAIESAAKLKITEHIPAIIHKLGHPLNQEDAVSALSKFGESAIPTLKNYLRDSHKPIELKQALVTALARIGSRDATEVLLKELDRKTSGLDTEIIDALDKIRSEDPHAHISQKSIKRKTLLVIKSYCRDFLKLQGLKPGKKEDEIRIPLQRQQTVDFMNIFKLLGLFYSHEDIRKAYQNLKTGTPDSMAYAVEMMDNTLKKDLRDLILPLIEDLSSSEREKKFRQLIKSLD